MGKYPILKPKEVVAILEKLGFIEVRQRGSHKQFRHLMADVQQYHFTQAETFRQYFLGRLPKMLVLLWKSY